jgi:hypothetical protein
VTISAGYPFDIAALPAVISSITIFSRCIVQALNEKVTGWSNNALGVPSLVTQ